MSLLGFREVKSAKINGTYKTDDPEYDTIIPIKFDARTKWLRCKLIGAVRDQGCCGSGWVSKVNQINNLKKLNWFG